ncbi:MAG TPA: penicillin-binding transpeptidase domain-containing protein [Solirubrobacteraceae bacterium]|nr:penicillin-binding transpeptidase domain-containing protein [Solirubrobacteraceae bacterium]
MSDQLLESVRDARPELPAGALSPDGAEGRAVLERVLAGRPRRRRRFGWRRALGGAPVALAIGATVVVAAVAVVTLRGHATAGPAGFGGHGARGEILDRDGEVLSPGLGVQAGLEAYYGAELKRGDTLRTSLDAALERTGQRALRHAIGADPPANGGAFVALDPQTGAVDAIGSIPNSATESAGPVGSTFTPITAIAALGDGAWSAGQVYDDTGQFCFEGQCRHNSGRAVDGVLDVQSALKVGSEDFFDNLGALTSSNGALEGWARAFGIGTATGVDLPRENPGTLPTVGRPGDTINLAVGQGDVEITPLQLAVAYAAIENGGTIVRPHLGLTLERPDGWVHGAIPPPVRHLNIDPLYLELIRQGLRAATSQAGGTSADVFGGFPEQVYGETGTAQYFSEGAKQDYAWYAGFVPGTATAKPIVVVVTVARGGFGDVAAAPVARQMLSQWFFGQPGPWVTGTSQTL